MDLLTAFRMTLGQDLPDWVTIQRVEDNTRAMTVYRSQDGTALAFGFEGTKGAIWPPSDDWLENLRAWKKAPSSGPGRVHAGFLDQYSLLSPTIADALRVYAPRTVYLCGFSQGAALATMAWRDLIRDAGVAVHGYAFASPRVYDACGAYSFGLTLANSETDTFQRIEVTGDPVSNLPPWVLDYQHVGPVVRLGPWRPFPDFSLPNPIHDPTNYITIIQGAMP